MPTLKIETLRKAAVRLLDEAERTVGSEIDLDGPSAPLGMYWTIALRDSYGLADEPERVVGDVCDDVTEVEDLVGRPTDETNLWHDLDHLSGVLRGLAFLGLPGRR